MIPVAYGWLEVDSKDPAWNDWDWDILVMTGEGPEVVHVSEHGDPVYSQGDKGIAVPEDEWEGWMPIPKRKLSPSPRAEGEKLFDEVENFLREFKFIPTHSSITGDGSKLFQFLHGEVQACVDVYPDGDIVILAKRFGEGEHCYELKADTDLAHIPKILASYGVPWGNPDSQHNSFFTGMRDRIKELEAQKDALERKVDELTRTDPCNEIACRDRYFTLINPSYVLRWKFENGKILWWDMAQSGLFIPTEFKSLNQFLRSNPQVVECDQDWIPF